MRHKALGLLLLIPIALVSLSTCGLENYIFLEAPTSLSSGRTLSFEHNPANSMPSFLGYEVYYRIYPGTSSTSYDSGQATVDIASISSSISAEAGADQTVKLLVAKGFKRMNQSTAYPVAAVGTPPFVIIAPVDQSKAGIRTSINLNDDTVKYSVPSALDVESFCSRNEAADLRAFSDFTWDSDDCDPSDTSSTILHPYIVAYAFAYALGDDFVAFYSYPVPLNESLAPTNLGN